MNDNSVQFLIDFDFGFGRKPFVEAGCQVTNCWTTRDRSWLNQSDALLFDAIEYVYNDLPRFRLPHQRYVYVHHEALPSTNPDKLNYDVFQLSKPHFFNWPMTHRRDSDIYAPHPYGILVRISPSVDQLPAMLPEGEHPSVVAPWSTLGVPKNFYHDGAEIY